MGIFSNRNDSDSSDWRALVTAVMTHAVAFLAGAGVIFTLLAAAMSQSFTVVSHGIEVICVPLKNK